jgi:hypothetical protein
VNIDFSHQVWIDPLVFAFIIAAMYPLLKDILGRVTRRNKDEHAKIEERNRRTDLLLLDWSGAPARPGFPAVPSFPERMASIEGHLAVIDHEVSFNSGSSIKDAVHRTDKAVAVLQVKLDEHLGRNTEETNAMMDRVIKEHDA